MGSNGIISFGTAYNSFINSVFLSIPGQYAVAPFWDDIFISRGGTISYETFESGYYLEQVNRYIQKNRPTTFEGTWMMNVFFKQVFPYSGSGEVNAKIYDRSNHTIMKGTKVLTLGAGR